MLVYNLSFMYYCIVQLLYFVHAFYFNLFLNHRENSFVISSYGEPFDSYLGLLTLPVICRKEFFKSPNSALCQSTLFL